MCHVGGAWGREVGCQELDTGGLGYVPVAGDREETSSSVWGIPESMSFQGQWNLFPCRLQHLGKGKE